MNPNETAPTVRAVSGTISRWLFAVTMCGAVFAITIPAPAAAQPPPKHPAGCCAKNIGGSQHRDNGCEHHAPIPEDDHCCAACAIGLSLFIAPPAAFIFTPPRGEELVVRGMTEASRFERPPVPPPRATLV